MNNQNLKKNTNISGKLKECLRTSEQYLRTVWSDCTAVFDRTFCDDDGDQKAFIDQIESLMASGKILKDGNTCYVSHVNWNGIDIVVKRYNNKGFFHSLRHTIKRSRARRCWLNAHRLKLLGIPTPQPVAYIETRKGMLITKSYLVTEYVSGKDILHFLKNKEPADREYDKTICQIKGILDALKRHYICHGDMKYSNIIVTPDGPTLIDIDAMVVFRWKWLFAFRGNKDYKRLSKNIPL